MAWIEVHQTLNRHPKLARLATTLRIPKAQAAGHLLFLWLWSLDYAPEGDLSSFGPAEIAAAADFTGDAEKFGGALRDTGWVESDGQIHDWSDYAGRLIERKTANKQRMRERRAPSVHYTVQDTCAARAQHVQDTCATRAQHVQKCVQLPNLTIPYQTKPKDSRAHEARDVPTNHPAHAMEARFKTTESHRDIFRRAHALYPGRKLDLDLDLRVFQRHSDWESALEFLEGAIQTQIAVRAAWERQGNWQPQWRDFRNWIEDRMWTMIVDAPPEKKKKPEEHDIDYQYYLEQQKQRKQEPNAPQL